MTTAGWVVLCVLGLVVGFIAGWARRRRAQSSAASTTATASRPTSGSAATSGTDSPAEAAPPADTGSSPEAAVIDLRVVSTPTAQATATGGGRSEPTEASPDPDGAATTAPRLALATPAGPSRAADTHITDAHTSAADTVAPAHTTQDHTAEAIDLSAGRAPIPLHNLQFIDGIGPRLDKRLRANGIVSVEDLAATGIKALRRLVAGHLPDDDARRLRDDARALLDAAERGRTAAPNPGLELRRVQGIGTTMMRWLETQGITSLEALASLGKRDLDRLEAALTDHPGRIRAEKWRGQARRLTRPPAD